MSNAWFFEKFELIADLPDAVSRMRELVLELAFQGRMATPATSLSESKNLVESLRTQRKILEEQRRIKRRDSTGFQEDEKPFGIPPNWDWLRLSDIGHELDQKKPVDDFTYIDVGCIESTVGQISERINVLDANTAPSRARKCVKLNTVIYSTVRPYLRNIAIVERDYLPEPIASTAFAILHPFDGVLSKYIFYWLRSTHFTNYVSAEMKGVAYPAISDQAFYNLPIPLPPLSEQRRIVAKVEELMGICDRLELEQRERESSQRVLVRSSLQRFSEEASVENLGYLFHRSYTVSPSDLRKTILTLAVQGKLVPQDPAEGSAEELMKQIIAHKAKLASNGRLRGPTAVTPLSETQAEFDIPAKWCWVRFGEITVNRDGERIPVSKEERETKEKKYDYYGASGVIDKIDRYLFDTPLLLIGEDGANLINRSTPIAFIARGKYWVNNHAHVLDGISEDFLRYIELHINAISLEKYITGSAQPKMNQAKMNSIPIALPPLAEQRRIVAKVEELMSMVDELEEMEKQATDRGSSLLDAIVHELAATAG